MSQHETALRAVLEALDEPHEFHGRSARIAYSALRAAGVDPMTAGWHTAKEMLTELESVHRRIAQSRQISGTTILGQRASDEADHARRLIVLANLRSLIVALTPSEAA